MLKKINWSQVAAAGLLAERVHSTLKEFSPKYSSFIETTAHKCKRMLRLTGAVGEVFHHHLGDMDVSAYWRGTHHASHVVLLSHFLQKYATIERCFFIENEILDALAENGSQVFIKKLNEYNPEYTAEKLEDVKETWSAEFFGGYNPEYVEEAYGICLEKYDCFLMNGRLFLAKYDNIPFAFVTRTCGKGLYHQTCFFMADPNYDNIRDKVDEIYKKYIDKFNPYRKAIISYKIRENIVIDSDDSFSTDDELVRIVPCENQTLELRYKKKNTNLDVFTEEVRRLISEDIPGFIQKQNDLCERGFDGRRAYLLAGPPGSGKSNIISSIIANLPDEYTVVLVPATDLIGLEWFFSHDFISPLFFVIEDIDLIIGDNKERQCLLNFLDGMRSPKKMITLMTTNHPDALGDSLINRPGRVDRICYVMPGQQKERSEQLAVLCSGAILPCSFEELASETEGFTFASHRELIRRAIIYSKSSEEIDTFALNKALEECKKQFYKLDQVVSH